jgi:hypothetical protein
LNRWVLFVFVMIAWSCEPAIEREQKSIDTYYDIDGLVDEQLLLLDSISPSLLKTANINGIKQKIDLSPTDSIWRRELEIFRSADINKPRLSDSYAQKEAISKSDSSIIYISKFPKSTLADTIRITFVNKLPSKIYASLRSQNTLFKSSKKLKLEFSNVNGRQMLTDYSVAGWQKMISKDATYFEIDGSMNLP